MSLFEFTFGLQAIILGLALTHMAVSVNRLVLARERVKWAARPLLAAILMLLTILLYWTQSWGARDVEEMTLGAVILRVVVNLMVFAAAAAILPEEAPRDDAIDLGAHYDKVRVYFFALFLAPVVVLSTVRPLVLLAMGKAQRFDNWENFGLIAAGVTCMVVKNRWVNLAVLSVLLVWMLSSISGYELGGE